METVALIVAGGNGKRTGQDIPKQFINVNDKPILIYTLESFQKHPEVDSIEVVCLDGWHEILRAYAKQYGITKIDQIVRSGKTVQESIRNGVLALQGKIADDAIVIIHDGIRPMIDEEVISDLLVVCRKRGNAVSSLPYNEQIFRIKDEESTQEYVIRETLRRVMTPQAYQYGKLYSAYEEAFSKGIGIYGSSYTNTMMVDLGTTLYFSKGSDKNIKITTADDIALFKAMLSIKNNL